MRIDAFDTFKGLCMIKGHIPIAQFREMSSTVYRALGVPYVAKEKTQDAEKIFRLYLKFRYDVGGRKAESYLKLLCSKKGSLERVKKLLGEKINEVVNNETGEDVSTME